MKIFSIFKSKSSKAKLLRASQQQPTETAADKTIDKQERKKILHSVSNKCGDFVSDINSITGEFETIKKMILSSIDHSSESKIVAESAQNNVLQSREISARLLDLMEELEAVGARVQESVETMKAAEREVKKIENLGQKIELVSFNASIEASRAGEFGKSFAVIAAEVQKLAEGSKVGLAFVTKSVKASSHNFTELSHGIKSAVKTSKEIINSSLEVLDNLSENIEDFSDSVAEIVGEGKKETEKIETISTQTKNRVENFNLSVTEMIDEISGTKIENISPSNAEKILSRATIIDVRRKEEFNDELGHVKGAILLTLSDNLEKDLAGYPKDQPYLFICRSGGRSARGAQIAQRAGFSTVFNMEGGMLRWAKENRPVA